MAEVKKYIAVDLGAESGRVMLGVVSDDKLELEEIHRFSNVPVEEGEYLRWDFGMLLSEIKVGIGKAVKYANQEIAGIGVDSWGAGIGLIDEKGRLIETAGLPPIPGEGAGGCAQPHQSGRRDGPLHLLWRDEQHGPTVP